MNIARVALVSWGIFCCIVMAYFALQWQISAASPLRHEALQGVAYGLVYGAPSWIGLPVYAWRNWRELSATWRVFIVVPVLVAGVLSVPVFA